MRSKNCLEKGLVLQSKTYQLYLLQHEEILKHKWIESQKAARDVGFEWALVDWLIHHRGKWLSEQKS